MSQRVDTSSGWGCKGPSVSGWFRRRLRKLDRRLGLVYHPPRCPDAPRGVDPERYPHGMWNICHKLPHSGRYHPIAVWSLTDSEGNYAPPGPDTIRLLRHALRAHKARQGDLFERELDRTLEEARLAKVAKSKVRLVDAMDRFCRMQRFDRQWTNRVCMRRRSPTREGFSSTVLRSGQSEFG